MHATAARAPLASRPPPTLLRVRLERTREVVREIARTAARALPIAIGVSGPLFIAVLALLAWSGLPVLKAPSTGGFAGVSMWGGETLLVAVLPWSLRRRLLPEPWCVQLRTMPVPAREAWRADLAVSALVLSPMALCDAVSALIVARGVVEGHAPVWWREGWPVALASAALSWATSCALGAGALAWQRRVAGRGHPARRASPTPRREAAGLPADAPGRPHRFPQTSVLSALLWRPSWRGALAPGGPVLLGGVLLSGAMALAWTRGAWPVVPGAAWAFLLAALSLSLTERAQRAMELHLAALEPLLRAWPVVARWRWQARALLALPALTMLGATAACVLASRPWRAVPLVGYVVVTLGAHALLLAIPAVRRESHVSVWAAGAGLATAFGSELW